MIYLLLSQSWNSAVYSGHKGRILLWHGISRALGALAAMQAGFTWPFEGQKGDFAMSAVMKLNLPQPTLHVTGIHYHSSDQKPYEPSLVYLHKLHNARPSAMAAVAVGCKSHPSCYLQAFFHARPQLLYFHLLTISHIKALLRTVPVRLYLTQQHSQSFLWKHSLIAVIAEKASSIASSLHT